MATESITRILLRKASMTAIMLWTMIALVCFWFIGNLFTVGGLQQIGLPLTVIMIGTSSALGYQIVDLMKTPKGGWKEVKTAPFVAGFLVSIFILIVAVFVLPSKFEQMYAVMELKTVMMSMVMP